jgi:2-polyprenyl-3-methyl-5-hydroxy-6-metoxy-1,4-benzoquinol methylase
VSGRTPLDYAGWRRSSLGEITERLERDLVMDLAGPLDGRDVLDAGCGDGAFALDAARAGARVSGIDASAPAIDAARDRAGSEGLSADLRCADLRSLHFPDASFDVVLAVTVLCFLPDAEAAVAEMARVLRPGGFLVLGELGRWNGWAAWRRLRGWLGNATWRGARFRSAAELRRLVAGAGLATEAVRGAVFYPPVGALARALGPIDAEVGRFTTLGAAFLALRARRPAAG